MSQSDPVAALSHVTVQIGSNAQVTEVTNMTVAKDSSGAVSDSSTQVDPLDAINQLPTRVLTSWWSPQGTGTDLKDTAGRSGQIAIQLSVENLTTRPGDVSFESNGVRYRQQALIGVPLTVTLSADLGKIPVDSVIGPSQADSSATAKTTDGVVSVDSDGDVTVQWARLLAPPVLSPTAAFTVVIQTDDFVPPDFNLTVQPGLVTDPSITSLVERSMGADGDTGRLESSTITLVSNVNSQLGDALEFIDKAHTTLQGDVSDLTRETVAELETGSRAVVSNLDSLQSQIQAIQQSTQTGLESIQSQTQQEIQALVSAIDEALGSTDVPPTLVAGSTTGCVTTLPTLADDQPHTLASAVYVLSAQLAIIGESFSDQSDQSDADAPPNCRTTLINQLTAQVGDPSIFTDAQAVEACLATDPDKMTIACSITAAHTRIDVALAQATLLASQARAYFDTISINTHALMTALTGDQALDLIGLAPALDTISAGLADARSDIKDLGSQIPQWVETMSGQIDQAKAAVVAMRGQTLAVDTDIDSVAGQFGDIKEAFAKPGGIYDQLDAAKNAASDHPTEPSTAYSSATPTPYPAPTTPSPSSIAPSPTPLPAPSARESYTPTATPTAPVAPSATVSIAPSPTVSIEPSKTSLPTPASGPTDTPAPVGQWFDSGYRQALDDVVEAFNSAETPQVCSPNWSDGLDDSSTVDDIHEALEALDTPTCPVSDMASSVDAAVTQYDEHENLVTDYNQAIHDRDDAIGEYNGLASDWASVASDYMDAADNRDDLITDHNAMIEPWTTLTNNYNDVAKERNGVVQQYNELVNAWNALVTEQSKVRTDRDETVTVYNNLAANWTALAQSYSDAVGDYDAQASHYNDLMGTWVTLVADHNSLVSDRQKVQSAITTIQNVLTPAIGDSPFDILDQDIAVLQGEKPGDPSSDLIAAILGTLDSLYLPATGDGGPIDHENPTGLLVDVQASINQIGDLWAAEPTPGSARGKLTQLQSTLDAVSGLVESIWPSDPTERVSPTTDLSSCAETLDTPLPATSGQQVVVTTNRLLCVDSALDQKLTALSDVLARTQAITDDDLGTASDRAQAAHDQVSAQVGSALDTFETSLDAVASSSSESLLGSVDQTRTQMQAQLEETLAKYGLSTDEMITSLTESMTMARTDSAHMSEQLSQDFTNLMINMGSTQAGDRTGMIGKLADLTDEVGDTGDVLDAVSSNVAAYGGNRAGELRDIDLSAAQYQAAQSLLATYQPFGNTDTTTVFMYHIEGGRA